jgi:hypothetical protein
MYQKAERVDYGGVFCPCQMSLELFAIYFAQNKSLDLTDRHKTVTTPDQY